MASSSGQDSSFVEMKDTGGDDAALVGKHCQYEYCKQLDFLPFFCQSCRGTFCLDHRTESTHECASAGAWAERRRLADLSKPSVGAATSTTTNTTRTQTKKPCAHASCETTVGSALNPGVHCAKCNRDYCLHHRLPEDHDCANLVPVGARPAQQGGARDLDRFAAGAKSALDKLKSWGAARKASLPKREPKANSPAARLAALNAMKKTAKGDEKLPAEKRVYLHVEAQAESTGAKIPQGDCFFSRDWVVGRVLDAAARELQVENLNNQSEGEENRLRVFHVEGGRLLEFGEKLGAAVASGNTIVLLRGVGPPPELINL